MKFISSLLKKPVTICMIVLLTLFLGIYSTVIMPVELLPSIGIPVLGVTVVYPGASADSVQKDVTDKIEDSLETIAGVTEITTYSLENASVAILSFEYETNLDTTSDDILDRIKGLSLPSSCYEPTITNVDFNASALATISFSVNSSDMDETIKEASNLQQALLGIDGVEKVTMSGQPVKTIMVHPIAGLEVSTLLLVQALSSSALDIPIGTILSDGTSVSIRNASEATSIEDLKKIPISFTLSSSFWDSFKGIQQIINYIDSSSIDKIETDGNNIQKLSTLLNQVEKTTADDLKADWEVIGPIIKTQSDKAKAISSSEWNATEFSKDLSKLITFALGKQVDLPKEVATLLRYAPFEAIEGAWNILVDLRSKLGGEITSQDYIDFFNKIPFFDTSSSNFLLTMAGMEFIRNFTMEKWENIISSKLITEGNLSDSQIEDLFNIFELDDIIGFHITADIIHLIKSLDFNTLITNSDGTKKLVIQLGSCATVTENTSYSSYSYYNDQASILLYVYNSQGSNASKCVNEVKKILASDSDGYNAVLLDDQASFIDSSISNVLTSILIGGALAIIVIYLFLRKVRVSLVIAITMPLSVLATLICLNLMGITLNMVSLGGLAVGIGMLVDNSIVVIESISKHRDNQEDLKTSCVEGVHDVISSLIASTLTTICVFFPILFTKGLTKEIFSDLAYAVILSLTFSILVAITIIPCLYYYFNNKDMVSKVHKAKKKEFKEPSFAKATNYYKYHLARSLNHKGIVILCSLLVFFVSIGLVFTTGQEFLPSIDTGLIEMNINFDADVSLEDAKATTSNVVKEIKKGLSKANYESIAVNCGVRGLLETSITGYIRIQLNEETTKTNEVVDSLRLLLKNKNIDGTVTNVDGVVATLTSGMSNLSINVLGDDPQVLEKIVNEVREKLLNEKGFTKVTDNISSKKTEYLIHVDKMKCEQLGLSYQTIITTLRVGISGYDSGNLDLENGTEAIKVSFANGAISSIDDLNNFVVGFSSSKAIKLSDIATLEKTSKNSIIVKYGKMYSVSIQAETSGLDLGGASKTLNQVTKEVLKNYEGYSAVENGVSSYLSTTFSGLIVALIVSVFLLFAIMACQFESLTKPLIVMASIPLSFTGGFLALSITRISLNVVSFIGVIMLMGVIVNNAIIMLDKIKQLEDSGMNRFDAVIEGCSSRLRPILITTLTTVLALIPLALAIGEGSTLMQPMAVVVIGGLSLGTFVTLFLIPAIYCLTKKIKKEKVEDNKEEEATTTDKTTQPIDNQK